MIFSMHPRGKESDKKTLFETQLKNYADIKNE